MIKTIKRITIYLFIGLLCFGPCLAFASEDAGVKESFKAFQKFWIKTLSTRGTYGPEYVKVEKDKSGQGMYVASYRELGETLASKIKETGQKSCPYVGVFSYEEKVYSSKGNSAKEASRGPFEYEKTVKITEIFRYGNGKWIY
jgi:hypothetical protein